MKKYTAARRGVWFVLVFLMSTSGSDAQESSGPSDTCVERLAKTEEELITLQDQHAMITLPRAEADQRALMRLRRRVDYLQTRVKELEQQIVKEREGKADAASP